MPNRLVSSSRNSVFTGFGITFSQTFPDFFLEWVARILAGFRSFEKLLPRVFLGYAHGVEIKYVIIRFREPDDGFIPAGKAAATVQTMFEVPDYAIPHP
jgi:hypothetical protein